MITPVDRAKGEKIVYPTPGLCIYCGRSDVSLSDEHIVPYSIAGDGVIFEDASCRECADKINKSFETHVLHSMFLPIRIRAGSNSRHKKRWPKTLQLKIVCADNAGRPIGPIATQDVPIENFPYSLMGWVLPAPGIIAGREPSDVILGNAWSDISEQEYAPFVAEYKRRSGHQGGVIVSVGRMNERKFFRFLAKTAYAYAVANEGYCSFKPLVLELIFGTSERYCHYIGGGDGHDNEPVGPEEAFRLRVGTAKGGRYLAVLVQLYSALYSPKYIVIVGECLEEERSLAKD